MNEYCVNCDITFSGNYYVQAKSEEEARNIVQGKQFVPSDIRNFYHFDTDIQDVELEEENIDEE